MCHILYCVCVIRCCSWQTTSIFAFVTSLWNCHLIDNWWFYLCRLVIGGHTHQWVGRCFQAALVLVTSNPQKFYCHLWYPGRFPHYQWMWTWERGQCSCQWQINAFLICVLYTKQGDLNWIVNIGHKSFFLCHIIQLHMKCMPLHVSIPES